jgi:hypothetical protein
MLHCVTSEKTSFTLRREKDPNHVRPRASRSRPLGDVRRIDGPHDRGAPADCPGDCFRNKTAVASDGVKVAWSDGAEVAWPDRHGHASSIFTTSLTPPATRARPTPRVIGPTTETPWGAHGEMPSDFPASPLLNRSAATHARPTTNPPSRRPSFCTTSFGVLLHDLGGLGRRSRCAGERRGTQRTAVTAVVRIPRRIDA